MGPRPYSERALRDVANLAATRGPHSHGFAWHAGEEGPPFGVHRGVGDLRGGLDRLLGIESLSLIGHSRLATTGTYAGGAPSLDDTMPFIAGDVAIVHNGNVRAYETIARTNGYRLTTGCDSEVIAHMVSHFNRSAPELPLSAHLSMVVDRIDDGRPFVVIAMNSLGEVAAMRRGLPLYSVNRSEGIYLCSRDPNWDDTSGIKIPEMLSWGYPSFTRRAA